MRPEKFHWAVVAVMSSSKDFSSSELNGLSVWELPLITDSSTGRSSWNQVTGNASTPMLKVSELESVQQQAYDEASKSGWDRGHAEGFEAGRKDGYQDGFKAGQSEVNQRVRDVLRIIDELAEPLRDLDECIEQELTALAMTVARQLVRRELKTDPGQVIAVVREALEVLPASARNVKLFLQPDDAELVRSVFDIAENSPNWTIIEDPLLSRGGCRIDTETSRVDATVEKQLAAAIAQAMGGERDRD